MYSSASAVVKMQAQYNGKRNGKRKTAMTPAELGQWLTPAWVPELIYQHFYPNLSHRDVVADPACGDARWLMALPTAIPAFGVDIDPAITVEARRNTTHPIICADFRSCELPMRPTLFIGNPPFRSALIDAFLERCYDAMDYGGRVGFILPAYYLQAASTGVRLSKKWSLTQTMLPKNLFRKLETPINFVQFDKDGRGRMFGFLLYPERDSLDALKKDYRARFYGNGSRANVWLETAYAAMKKCGKGPRYRTAIADVYACIENERPTENPFWRDKLRQIFGEHFVRVERGVFEMPDKFLSEIPA
jgi:adenine-specific DNA-methyltransferase